MGYFTSILSFLDQDKGATAKRSAVLDQKSLLLRKMLAPMLRLVPGSLNSRLYGPGLGGLGVTKI
jgi:hypothetical protein